MFFDSAMGWRLASEAGRSFLRLIFLHALPLLLVGCVAEGYGMVRWGKRVGELGAMKTYALPDVVRYEAIRFGLAVLLVLVLALLVRILANTFHAKNGFLPTLTLAVFGLGPVFLLRIADAFPVVNPWLSWGIGAVLAAGLLYQGIPRVLRADPAHAIGLYLSSAMLVILGSGLAQLAGLFFLEMTTTMTAMR